MDEIVKQAMIKWPQVPDCYGWLGLDMRGEWFLRDDAAQAFGTFGSGIAGAKGSKVQHEKLLAFLARNYASDGRGCWYFQNGPQKVFVELGRTPWIWRLEEDGVVTSHTGQQAVVRESYLDEDGLLYLDTNIGFGLVHTADMGRAASRVENGHWAPVPLESASMPGRFGYVMSPHMLAGQRGC